MYLIFRAYNLQDKPKLTGTVALIRNKLGLLLRNQPHRMVTGDRHRQSFFKNTLNTKLYIGYSAWVLKGQLI